MTRAFLRPRKIDHGGIATARFSFEKIIAGICALPWEHAGEGDILRIAHAYYYFSIQFRENLEIACRLYPADEKLRQLRLEECDTSNLSPWEGIAGPGEAMNHDEFMRRLLTLWPASEPQSLEHEGLAYLARIRRIDERVRAKSIASYEDGGLCRVFSAILRAPVWCGAGQRAFRHFLQKHIAFDAGGDGGHGALSRHLHLDDSIAPLWAAFAHLLNSAVPKFTDTETMPRPARIEASI